MIKSLVKLPKYKRFEFQTRYYNPEKEELSQRVRDIEARLESEKNGGVMPEQYQREYASRISRSFRENRRRPTGVGGFFSSAFKIRLLIVAVMASCLYLYLEFGDKMEELLQSNSISGSLGWVVAAMALFLLMRTMRKNR